MVGSRCPAWRFVAVLLVTLPGGVIAQTDGGNSEETYSIQPGDVLSISVWREPELQAAEVLVRPDGKVSFPLAGELSAAGRTIMEVTEQLEERLGVFIPDLFVTVTIQQIVGNKIYILGQVQDPGAYVMNPRIDITQALSIAGGFTAFADSDNIQVLRRSSGEQTVLSFDYGEVSSGRQLEQNVLLESGDVIIVP